jgi:predicted PurR-regulated permease PerM
MANRGLLIGLGLWALFKLFAWGVAWPFFFGWILAYMYRPFVVRLTRLSIPHGWAAFVPFFLTYLVLIVFFLFFPDYLLKVSGQISHAFSKYYDVSVVRKEASHLYASLQKMDPRIGDIVYQVLSTAGRHTLSIISSIIQGGVALAQTGLTLFFIPLIGFYFAKDWIKMGHGFYDLCPKPYRTFLRTTLIEMKRILGHYLHGQMLVAMILVLYYTVALSILGIHGSILIGCLSGLLVFIPYMGPILGFFISCSTIIVQKGSFTDICIVLGIYVLGNLLESMFLTPVFLGKKIGLHALWILFFAYMGFSVGGAPGIFASLPLACVVSVLCKIIYRYYTRTDFFQDGFFLSPKK